MPLLTYLEWIAESVLRNEAQIACTNYHYHDAEQSNFGEHSIIGATTARAEGAGLYAAVFRSISSRHATVGSLH